MKMLHIFSEKLEKQASRVKQLNQEIINRINKLKSDPDVFQDYDNIEALCYLNLEKYDVALELYKNREMYNEVGEIYFQNKHDYEEAFEYFKRAHNISNAIKSIAKSDKRGHFLKLFEYINDENVYNNLDYLNIIIFMKNI